MRSSRPVGPIVLVTIYGLLYVASWYPVWRADQVDQGDGLQYVGVIVMTAPWSLLSTSIYDWIPASLFPALLTGYALVNTTLLWWAGRRLLP